MFNIGPSNAGMPDWLRKKTGGNTGITGGMGAPRLQPGGGYGPVSKPQVMPRRPMPPSGEKPFGMGPMPMSNRGGAPVSTTMPVGRPRPQIIPLGNEGIGTPGEQPLQENQLWRTYNRMLGGSMGPRMLF